MHDSRERYGSVSRTLHWGMALLIVWQFLSVWARVMFEDSAFDDFMWATHRPLGALLMLLILVRIGWALTNRSRRPPPVSAAAKWGHVVLYGFLFATPALGLLRQYGSGRVFEPFGVPLFSGFDGEIDWMVQAGHWFHSSLGWTLMVLVIGHIGMAIWHRRRADQVDVLPRMWR